MTATEFRGPYNCAECGTPLALETTLAGDADHLTVTIRGHVIEIPGLYVCTPCAGAIMVGERESRVTWEAIVAFLDGTYGPLLCASLLFPPEGSMVSPEDTAARLKDVMEVQFILESCIELRDQPGGLDFIPECTGDCGGEHVHPREMATFN